MLIIIILAIPLAYFFTKMGGFLKYLLVTALLLGGSYLMTHHMFDGAWWSDWILSPLIAICVYFMLFFHQTMKVAKDLHLVDNEDLPRLEELFGNYKYRNRSVEGVLAKTVNLNGTTRDMLYTITTDERYFSPMSSINLLLCEAYINASQGDYTTAAKAAATLCKNTDVKEKDGMLGIFEWIITDPQLCQRVFDTDGKLKESF